MLQVVCLFLLLLHHADPAPDKFLQASEVSYIHSAEIDEASGLAASRIHKDILYTMNDHSTTQNENRIFAIQASTGQLAGTITLDGAVNGDWEDIAVGPCHGNDSCIFIADTGEGSGRHPRNHIYRLREPQQLGDQTIHVTDQLRFRWTEPEGECIMVDDVGDVYIVSRVKGGHGLIARLPFGGWGGPEVDLTATARLNISTAHHDPRACDISPDGRGMLIKAEDDIYYWLVSNRDYVNAATQPAEVVPYLREPYGESVAWSATGDGYYTLSEGRHAHRDHQNSRIVGVNLQRIIVNTF